MSEAGTKRVLLGYTIDVQELLTTILDGWQLILTSTAGAVLLAVAYLHVAEYTYTATLVVSPVTSSSSDGLSGKLGNLGGLASLAGVSLGGSSGSQAFMLYQNGLQSRDVAEALSRQPGILQQAFEAQWDPSSKQWRRPSSLVSGVVRTIKSVLGIPSQEWQPPDGALLQEYIAKNVAVDADPLKPIVTITFRHRNSQFAIAFINALDRTVDNKLRHDALERANQYVDYLSRALSSVTTADIRESLVSALAEQEKVKMMASATAPFAAQPFDQPSASRRPTSPNPVLILFGAFLAGAVLGILATIWLSQSHWPES